MEVPLDFGVAFYARKACDERDSQPGSPSDYSVCSVFHNLLTLHPHSAAPLRSNL